ncbi:MAG TPA: phage holin family protein [Nodosilinea sp.]|nr:phage holin family protein [Nodosilinea sp.]
MLIGFLISVVILAISLLIISKIPPIGVEIDSPIKALLGGAIIGAFNGIWGFFPNALRGFFAIISLGLVPLIGAIIVFGLAAWLIEGFRLRYGIWSAILGAIALAIISSILNAILRSVGLLAV